MQYFTLDDAAFKEDFHHEITCAALSVCKTLPVTNHVTALEAFATIFWCNQVALHLQLCNFTGAEEKPFKIRPKLTATAVDTRNPFLCKYYTRSCRTINKTFSGMLCMYNGQTTAMWENTSTAAVSIMNETWNQWKIICHRARAFLFPSATRQGRNSSMRVVEPHRLLVLTKKKQK